MREFRNDVDFDNVIKINTISIIREDPRFVFLNVFVERMLFGNFNRQGYQIMLDKSLNLLPFTVLNRERKEIDKEEKERKEGKRKKGRKKKERKRKREKKERKEGKKKIGILCSSSNIRNHPSYL